MLATVTMRRADEAEGTARLILQSYPEVRVFAMHGDLGSGKTTLIKGFCAALGVKDHTSSPSFAIVNEYLGGSGEAIYHFDLYRLRDTQELQGIGFEEYVDSGSYCFIEWPELAEALLPQGTLHVRMEATSDGSRRVSLGQPEGT